MTILNYSDFFWAPDLNSVEGFEALVKRNHDSKKMCGELEEYLKKRSKLEAEYSKSLAELARTFRDRKEIGTIEATLVKLKVELNTIASSHFGAASFFQNQAEAVKKFKTQQMTARKALEETLSKSQSAKLAQFNKTMQLEKSYVRKSVEKDNSEVSLKEAYNSNSTNPKDIEKARSKATKAADEAEKADAAYKSAVMLLEDCRVKWEMEMENTCKSIQKLDEERIRFLRQDLWTTINAHSKVALDIDNSCESVRSVLEKCSVEADINAYVRFAGVGEDRPEPFQHRHYTQLTNTDSDSNSSMSGANEYASPIDFNDDDDHHHKTTTLERKGSGKSQKGGLTLPRMFGKKKLSNSS